MHIIINTDSSVAGLHVSHEPNTNLL